MPPRIPYERLGGWWANKTRLEQILIVLLTISSLTIIVLSAMVGPKSPGEKVENVCKSPTCVKEAGRILSHIDESVNPCKDFHQFVCGNFIKSLNGDDSLEEPTVIKLRRKIAMESLYLEESKESDHKMVKFVRNMFRGCINKTEINSVGLQTVKKVIKELGGWPLLEGASWDEKNFDWIKATYKLRELGYDYSIFFKVVVSHDFKETGYNYQITKTAPPKLESNELNEKFVFEQTVLSMANFVQKLKNEEAVHKEIADVHTFIEDLKKIEIVIFSKTQLKKILDEYPNFNWLNFINDIIGPGVQLSEADSVFFPIESDMMKVLNIIQNASKRTQANYLIWKFLYQIFPYLFVNREEVFLEDETVGNRVEFCIKTIENRFVPNPIDVLYDRKYLTKKRKDKLLDFLRSLKGHFISKLNTTDWMDEKDRKNIVDAAKGITFIVGKPFDHFDDKIFDTLDIHHIFTNTDNFIEMLAQATKNRQTKLFNQIRQSTLENILENDYVQKQVAYPITIKEIHVMYFPTSVVSYGNFFNEDRPNYLNYGSLGFEFFYLLKAHEKGPNPFSTVDEEWSRKTKTAFEKKKACLTEKLEKFDKTWVQHTVYWAMQFGIGQELSYLELDRSVKSNEEKSILGLSYTPKQLFWISSVSTYCYGLNMYKAMVLPRSFRDIIDTATANSPNFAVDFNCPDGSTMKAENFCKLL